MDNQTTVLNILKKARDLVNSGYHADVLEAISALKADASGPKRDLAYYAVLETAAEGRGEVGLSDLSAASRDAAMALLDATIRRMTSKLH
ncbi:hypothetical protein [Microvirga makkahensis]|uniref:Uncharacterized protein n=1 Tax=Microvirga makkahensis TaxID=1128670 RepID=A0A7X3MN73_9HYPH|nr:hypothetical protein [Microvirga makkahensis]MXQ10088.1 hypothetical protein [Microvirga makkahensis]